MNHETLYQANISLVFRCEDNKQAKKAQEVYELLLLNLLEQLENESDKHGFNFNLNHDNEPLEIIW